MQRLTGTLVPGDHGFALVGDPDCRNPACPTGRFDNLPRTSEGLVPDLGSVVLDPTRLGVILGQFLLGDTLERAIGGEEHGPG